MSSGAVHPSPPGNPTTAATERRPFDPSKTGKIAVKVINHYGDDNVMNVPLIPE
jgi:hypothetical protein